MKELRTSEDNLCLSSVRYSEGSVATSSSSTSKTTKDQVVDNEQTSLFSVSGTVFLRKPEVQSRVSALLLIKSLLMIAGSSKGVKRRLLCTNNGGPARRVTQSAKHCAIIHCRDVKRLAYSILCVWERSAYSPHSYYTYIHTCNAALVWYESNQTHGRSLLCLR